MEKPSLNQVKIPEVPQKKVPSMGESKSEVGHRMLASQLLTNLQTWAYFKPHIYLIKEEQDVRYANSPDKFKAALQFGVNCQVVEPIPSKASLLRCIYSEIYWQRNKFFDELLSVEGARLRDKWLQGTCPQIGPVVCEPGGGAPGARELTFCRIMAG
jgi:hypothetical protein